MQVQRIYHHEPTSQEFAAITGFTATEVAPQLDTHLLELQEALAIDGVGLAVSSDESANDESEQEDGKNSNKGNRDGKVKNSNEGNRDGGGASQKRTGISTAGISHPLGRRAAPQGREQEASAVSDPRQLREHARGASRTIRWPDEQSKWGLSVSPTSVGALCYCHSNCTDSVSTRCTISIPVRADLDVHAAKRAAMWWLLQGVDITPDAVDARRQHLDIRKDMQQNLWLVPESEEDMFAKALAKAPRRAPKP